MQSIKDIEEGQERLISLSQAYNLPTNTILDFWDEYEKFAAVKKNMLSVRGFEMFLRLRLSQARSEIKSISPVYCIGFDPLNPRSDNRIDIKKRVTTAAFINLSPLLLLQMTHLKGYSKARLWGIDEPAGIIFLTAIYLGCLIYLSPLIELKVSETIPNTSKKILFFGAVLAFLTLFGSFFYERRFDLLLKLGCIGTFTTLQYLIASNNSLEKK